MANKLNHSELSKTVDAWYKCQAEYEAAKAQLDETKRKAQSFARTIYESLGTQVFSVKAAGPAHPGYRAFYKKERLSKTGNTIKESWDIIPVPQNAPTQKF